MALIKSNKPQRVEVPNEDGQWVELVPLAAGDLELLQADSVSGVRATIEALERCVKGWSYDEPVTPETLRRLDIDSFLFLGAELMRISGIRTEAEKNSSEPKSSGILPPDAGNTPANLATSSNSNGSEITA